LATKPLLKLLYDRELIGPMLVNLAREILISIAYNKTQALSKPFILQRKARIDDKKNIKR